MFDLGLRSTVDTEKKCVGSVRSRRLELAIELVINPCVDQLNGAFQDIQ
jgi:hypothetical protein